MNNQLRPFAAGVVWTIISIFFCLWLMNVSNRLPGGAKEPAPERTDG